MKKNRKASRSTTTNDLERDIPSPDTSNTEGQQKILELIASLNFSSKYSDLKIICENKVFSAHKLVVCPRSEYFHKACYGGFKEAKEPIHLGDKSPILLKKVLEFLYTGDYFVGSPRPESDSPQADGDEKSDVDTESARGPPISSQSDGNATYNLTPETEELVTEIDLRAPKSIAVELANTSPKSEAPALFRERPENGLSKQWGARKPAVDPLIDCHPCYFHMRMYGDADYFMISDLKTKAREQFCASFVDFSDKEHFTEIIDELYSTRANYWELRKLAINMIVADLPNLRKAFTPMIDPKLLKAVPEFAVDLCLATMDRYVPFPSIFKGKKDGSAFQPMGSTGFSAWSL